ncbi:hypothetical protein [Salaquimonas pukyongi]|uniref:hypothetical protein n=1 Tax=Salaquimonas pukyongi TaxID=2712698 RepID=UPI00096BB454|nr:hypothetical protein [Salaquimonas pukyongi]
MTNKRPNTDNARAEESKRILERIERESETVAASSMARTSDLLRKGLSGKDGNSEDADPVEVLGKRIGRTLGWIAMIALVVYLLVTYVF